MSEDRSRPQVFGKYTLVDKITTGGMAEVYRGFARGPQGFSRLVAIKKILPQYANSREFMRMFVDEATIAARLNHANIAQIYDFDIHEGTPYIAMEFVEGKDLRSILRAAHERPLQVPYPVAVYIALEAAKGLYYVHSRRESSRPLNIIHRDVSPQNVMLSYSGDVKLVDFGIARAATRETETVVGTVKGKYAYMSPEQLSGHPLDHRTDLFSLGIVLWEMLTLNRLFAAPSEGETIQNVLRKRIQPPHELRPDIPEALSPIVLRALERDRRQRYPTMLAFHEALSSFLFSTGSYPAMEQVTSFLHDLFPDEMDRLKQGEHLVFDVDSRRRGDDETTAPDHDSATEEAGATVVASPRPERAVQEPLVDTRSAFPVEPTDTTRPTAHVGRLEEPRPRSPLLGTLMLVVVLGLATLFGWQLYRRIQHTQPGTEGTVAAHSEAPADTLPAPSTNPSVPAPEATGETAAKHSTPPSVPAPEAAGETAAGHSPTPPAPDAAAEAPPTAGQASKSPPSPAADNAPAAPSTHGEPPAEQAAESPPSPAADNAPAAPSTHGKPPAEQASESPPSPAGGTAAADASTAVAAPSMRPPSPGEDTRKEVLVTLLADPPDALIVIGNKTYSPGQIRLEVEPDETVLARISKGGYAMVEDRFLPVEGLEKRYELHALAHLVLWVEPTDAIVKVNGRELTRSGKEGHYVHEVGLHDAVDLYVHRADFHPREEHVTIDRKKVKRNVKLTPRTPGALAGTAAPAYGAVKVVAKPYAMAYYGPEKQSWGRVPPMLKKTLPEGDHEIHLYYAGIDSWYTCKVTVRAGHASVCNHDFIEAAEKAIEEAEKANP